MLLEALGWFGTISYLLNHAYISLVQHWNKSVYYGINFIAGTSLVISSLAIPSSQAVTINLFWAAISFTQLANIKSPSLPFNARFIVLSAFFFWLLASGSAFYDLKITIAILGWSSAYTFCFAYFLFASGKISARFYFVCNAYAALVLLPQLWFDANWPVFVLEVCWAMLSLYGFHRKTRDPVLP